MLQLRHIYFQKLMQENAHFSLNFRTYDVLMDVVAMRTLPRANDVTLLIYCGSERLNRLLLFLRYWDGPVSAAILVDDNKHPDFIKKTLRSQPVLSSRGNIDIHVVKKRGVSSKVHMTFESGIKSLVVKASVCGTLWAQFRSSTLRDTISLI